MGWKGMIFLRFMLLALLVLACSAPAMAQEASPLRRFVWGASPEDVRKFELGRWYKEEGGSDFYVEKPDKYRRTIRYDFRDGKLWRAQYSYNELHNPNPMKIFDEAADFQIALEKIYGEPKTQNLVWKNQRYRRYPELLGSALRNGDMRIESTWELPGTKVLMQVYKNGPQYELTYTAEKIDAAPKMDTSRNILNLPLGGETNP